MWSNQNNNIGYSYIVEDARKKTTVVWSCEEKRRIIRGDKSAEDGATG